MHRKPRPISRVEAPVPAATSAHPWLQRGRPARPGHARIGFEDEGNPKPVVDFRDRSTNTLSAATMLVSVANYEPYCFVAEPVRARVRPCPPDSPTALTSLATWRRRCPLGAVCLHGDQRHRDQVVIADDADDIHDAALAELFQRRLVDRGRSLLVDVKSAIQNRRVKPRRRRIRPDACRPRYRRRSSDRARP